MARQYETLVAAMAAAPDRPVATLPLMDDGDARPDARRRDRARTRAFPAGATIHARFAEQVRGARRRRRRSAGSTTTRSTLAANRLARELRARGVGPGCRSSR